MSSDESALFNDGATAERHSDPSTTDSVADAANEGGAGQAEPSAAAKVVVAGEYNPLKRAKGFSVYVDPGQYNPSKRRRTTGGGGWKYDPMKIFGRWNSSYIPDQETDPSKGELLCAELRAAEVSGGDLPLAIHDSLVQLRTQLLETESSADAPGLGTNGVVDFQVLESTQVNLTAKGPTERGSGAVSYYSHPAKIPAKNLVESYAGTNTQLTTGRLSALGLPMGMPSAPPPSMSPAATANMSAFSARLSQFQSSVKK